VSGPNRRPTRRGAVLASAVAVPTTAVLAALSPAAGAVAAVGAACLLAGVVRGSRRLVSAWLVAAWLGAVLVATDSTPPPTTAGVVLAAVVAWDAGQRAVGLGRDLTRAAATARVETVHAGATAAVGATTLAVAYGAFAGVRALGGAAGAAALALSVGATALLSLLVRRVEG